MVALLGDVDAGFGLFLLIAFLVVLVKGMSSGGGGNGLSWDQRSRLVYKDAIKDDFHGILLKYALEDYYNLTPKEREIILYCGERSKPLRIRKTVFYPSDILMIRGMWLEREKEKKKRARRIARLRRLTT